MARVNIEGSAWLDPRFHLLGRALRIAKRWRVPAAIGVMARIWEVCTERGVDRLPVHQLEVLLDVPADRVVEILCDQAELGELLPDGAVRIRGCEGRTEWLAERRSTAKAGGVERASTAERDDAGRFEACDAPRESDGTFAPRPGELSDEILSAVAAHPMTRSELRDRLQTRKKSLLRVVRDLLDAGRLTVDELGRLAVPGQRGTEDHGPGTGPTEPDGTARTGSVVPRVPSAPAPAPARAPAREAHAPTHAGNREPPPTPGEPGEPPERAPWTPERLAAAGDLAPRHERRDVARALWAYQNARRKQLDPDAPDIPLADTPGGSLDAVILALATYSPTQCMHALDIFAVEAACKRAAGEDALEYLNGRTNWKSEQLSRAVATTPEAVRKRYATRAKASPAPPSGARLERLG